MPITQPSADVVIVGGGIIGCAIAYSLAKDGTRVTIVERDTVGAHASSAAAGMLGAQVETTHPGPFVSLCLESRARFARLADELYAVTGIDVELNRAGLLRLAQSEEERQALLARAEWQRAFGESAEWLDGSALRDMEPAVSDAVVGALSIPGDHQVNAAKLTRAFAEAAVRSGARIVEHSAVERFLMDGKRVVGVETETGVHRAEWTVLAAGAWSGVLGRRLGLRLPVGPVKGESLSVTLPAVPFRKTLFAHGCYLVPKQGGRVVIGATEVHAGFDRTVTLKALAKLGAAAKALVPALAEATFERAWASVRPHSADGLPFLGTVEGHPGLVVATGHFRNGILLAPITGELIAELIRTGQTPVLLAPFSPNRLWASAKEVSAAAEGGDTP
ncbi:MAG: glycine oxidase ThiO [Bacillota bacterium]